VKPFAIYLAGALLLLAAEAAAQREICLSKGGTVEAGMPGRGASRPPPAAK
jgi:hypothetical protein